MTLGTDSGVNEQCRAGLARRDESIVAAGKARPTWFAAGETRPTWLEENQDPDGGAAVGCRLRDTVVLRGDAGSRLEEQVRERPSDVTRIGRRSADTIGASVD